MKINQLIKNLVTEIVNKSHNQQLFVVGLSGLDASGKTQIAKHLAEQLASQKVNAISVSGDAFQYPREYKEDLQEKDWATQHIKRTINFDKMIRNFLEPLQNLPKTLPLNIVDYDTKKVIKKNVSLTYPLIVIIESIYLFQKSIIPYLNYKIFLDISINEALKRAQSRKRDLNLYNGSTGVEKKYSMKNFPGYIQFEKEEDPKQYADVIIDNNNWKNPVVVRG